MHIVKWQSSHRTGAVIEHIDNLLLANAQASRALKSAANSLLKASMARALLPPGTSRARVTSANANYTSAAEARLDAFHRLQAIGDIIQQLADHETGG